MGSGACADEICPFTGTCGRLIDPNRRLGATEREMLCHTTPRRRRPRLRQHGTSTTPVFQNSLPIPGASSMHSQHCQQVLERSLELPDLHIVQRRSTFSTVFQFFSMRCFFFQISFLLCILLIIFFCYFLTGSLRPILMTK